MGETGQLKSLKSNALTANTGFASGGVTCKLGVLCFYSSSVLVDPEGFRDAPKPARSQSPKNVTGNRMTTHSKQ